jgi:dTMP kinase
VLLTREPGGSEGAEAIRRLLLEGAAGRWSAGAEALLFAAARADHVTRTIRPALAEGRWVISDRFLDSSLAYQGGADGIDVMALRQLHEVGSDGLLPHRTLLLTLPEAVAAERAAARDRGQADRFGARDAAYHSKVAAAFLALADAEPRRFRKVDAFGSERDVTARLLAAVEDLL